MRYLVGDRRTGKTTWAICFAFESDAVMLVRDRHAAEEVNRLARGMGVKRKMAMTMEELRHSSDRRPVVVDEAQRFFDAGREVLAVTISDDDPQVESMEDYLRANPALGKAVLR